jgi:hypothetical protein
MNLLVICWLLQALFVSALHADRRNGKKEDFIQIIPSTPFPGHVKVNTVSKSAGFDGPQLSAVSNSSYEWWYFDAVSTDHLSSITIVFYTALASGFGFIPPTPDVTTVGIDFSFQNGTASSVHLSASEAIITTIGQGSSGCFEKSGAVWKGAPDLSSYLVEIDAPGSGVVGTLRLDSVAPAQYVSPSTVLPRTKH